MPAMAGANNSLHIYLNHYMSLQPLWSREVQLFLPLICNPPISIMETSLGKATLGMAFAFLKHSQQEAEDDSPGLSPWVG